MPMTSNPADASLPATSSPPGPIPTTTTSTSRALDTGGSDHRRQSCAHPDNRMVSRQGRDTILHGCVMTGLRVLVDDRALDGLPDDRLRDDRVGRGAPTRAPDQ